MLRHAFNRIKDAYYKRAGEKIHRLLSVPRIGDLPALVRKIEKYKGTPALMVRNHFGRTPFHAALESPLHGDIYNRFLHRLLDATPDIDTVDNDGNSPLISCIWQDGLVGKLLARGADVNRVNKQGHTALILNVHRGDVASAQLLLAAGADKTIGYKTFTGAVTPLLQLAVDNGHGSMVQQLLDHHADVNEVFPCGHTPLTRVMENLAEIDMDFAETGAADKFIDVANLLIRTPGVDLDARGPDGRTPLMTAINAGDSYCRVSGDMFGPADEMLQIVKNLLRRGASVEGEEIDHILERVQSPAYERLIGHVRKVMQKRKAALEAEIDNCATLARDVNTVKVPVFIPRKKPEP